MPARRGINIDIGADTGSETQHAKNYRKLGFAINFYKKMQLFWNSFVVTITSLFNNKFWFASCTKRTELKYNRK
ncbi:hypothetical protein C6496_00645 [Candidatus Poribacteria bacterium]|nr:MAG: hypothetical protein C6496_00645 [Candidatus Poribacteria bacterium]